LRLVILNTLFAPYDYPKPGLLVVTTDARPAFVREYDGRKVQFLTLDRLVERIAA
jgi:hypothetical protein